MVTVLAIVLAAAAALSAVPADAQCTAPPDASAGKRHHREFVQLMHTLLGTRWPRVAWWARAGG